MHQIRKYFRRAGKSLARFWARVKKGSVLDIAILAAALLLVAALIAIAVVALVTGGAAPANGAPVPASSASLIEDPDYDKDAAAINVDEYDGVILPQAQDAGEAYIEETLFIGDSNTARMLAYGATQLANNIGVSGMGIQHVTSTPCVYLSGYSDMVKVPRAVELMAPRRIIITFGTNNTAWDAEVFKEQYREALDAIHTAYGYADIIINAVPPVAKTRSYPDITMTAIDSFNKALAELAQEEGYWFLNSSEALKDPATGYAREGYMVSDGIHLSEAGMDALMTYIRTHPSTAEDARPEDRDEPAQHVRATPETLFLPEKASSSQAASSEKSASSDKTPAAVSVVFTVAGDTAGGSLSGALSQSVAPGGTCSAVSVLVNPGYTFTWGCTEGSIPDVTASSLAFTVPAATQSSSITVVVTFQKTACQHQYAETVTQQPTCSAPGLKTVTCTLCGESHTEEIPATGAHTYQVTSEVPAQPGVPGSRVYTCTVCGTSYTEEIPALPVSSTPATPPASTPTVPETPPASTPTAEVPPADPGAAPTA